MKAIKEAIAWLKFFKDKKNTRLTTMIKIQSCIAELEALQQRSCEGCGYGKITINSVICGKNGTYKEADDYCKYYNPKEQ